MLKNAYGLWLKPAVRINDQCQFQERGLRPIFRGGSRTKTHIHQQDVCPSGLWLQNFLPIIIGNVSLRKRISGLLLCIHGVQPYTAGLLQTNNFLDRQQISHKVFFKPKSFHLPFGTRVTSYYSSILKLHMSQ